MARDYGPSHHSDGVFSSWALHRFFCQYTLSAKLPNINVIFTFCSYNYSEILFSIPIQDHLGVYSQYWLFLDMLWDTVKGVPLWLLSYWKVRLHSLDWNKEIFIWLQNLVKTVAQGDTGTYIFWKSQGYWVLYPCKFWGWVHFKF